MNKCHLPILPFAYTFPITVFVNTLAPSTSIGFFVVIRWFYVTIATVTTFPRHNLRPKKGVTPTHVCTNVMKHFGFFLYPALISTWPPEMAGDNVSELMLLVEPKKKKKCPVISPPLIILFTWMATGWWTMIHFQSWITATWATITFLLPNYTLNVKSSAFGHPARASRGLERPE